MEEAGGSVVKAGGLAVAGAVGTQIAVPEVGWETPFGFEVTARMGAGVLTLVAASQAKKKKTRRRLLFAGIGSLAGESAVQAYKMKISIFDSVGDDDAEPAMASASAA